MQITLNALLLSGAAGYRSAGIHRYIAELLRALPDAAPEFDFTAWVGRGAEAPDHARLRVRQAAWSTVRPALRIAWEQGVQPWTLDGSDLLHAMAYAAPVLCPCPHVVTVYDLSFWRTPERFRASNRVYLQTLTRHTCQHARRVIAISASTRQDVATLLGVPEARIAVAPPGVGPQFQPLPEAQVAAFRQRIGLPERVILYLGTIEPRKNLVTLIEAFARLKSEHTLILAGGRGWLYEDVFARVETLGLQDRVRFPGYVPAEDLPLWYNAAEVFAYPSVYEGFGIPVVEALACGTPVVTTSASSLPEAAGPVGVQTPPGDVGALAEALHAVLSDPHARESTRVRGPAWTARFTWEATARATADAYRRALREPAP